MTDNPRNWQPPYEDDDEFWKRFEDSLNAAQGKNPNAGQSRSSATQANSKTDSSLRSHLPSHHRQMPSRALAWIAVIVGPLLALVGYIFAVSTFLGGIGIGATIVGFIILIARRDRHIPPGEDHGDGAVV